MKMESKDLIALIEAYETFQKNTQNTDLESFAYWILKQEKQSEDSQLNRDLGYSLNRVNRHSKIFAKQFLADLPIQSLDEFSFLTSIKVLGNPSKSEVYEHTITELATGQQMMRRLMNLLLVEEIKDEKDRRIKRVKLTTKGDEIQSIAFQRIGQECDFKFNTLDEDKKKNLLLILKQLLNTFEMNKILR